MLPAESASPRAQQALKSEAAEEHFGAQVRSDVAAPEDGRSPPRIKWSKIAKNLTVSLPEGRGGWLDLV